MDLLLSVRVLYEVLGEHGHGLELCLSTIIVFALLRVLLLVAGDNSEIGRTVRVSRTRDGERFSLKLDVLPNIRSGGERMTPNTCVLGVLHRYLERLRTCSLFFRKPEPMSLLRKMLTSVVPGAIARIMIDLRPRL